MDNPILGIEATLKNFWREGTQFGPEHLTINRVSEAHNGYNGYTLRVGNSKFYNGVNCMFDLFSVTFITHEGLTFFRPGKVNVLVDFYINPAEDSAPIHSIDNLLVTVEEIVAQMPDNGIEYRPIQGFISLYMEQWQRVREGKSSLFDFLQSASEHGFIIELTGENGRKTAYLQYIVEQGKFIVNG